MRRTILWLVVPCLNEQEVLYDTARSLKSIMNELITTEQIHSTSKVLFVNDGSKDETWNIIASLCKEDDLFAGMSLSRNEGQQKALYAGLMKAKEYADAVISLDADLQDDVLVIKQMLKQYEAGSDIVYGVRGNRDSDSYMKRHSAKLFYRLMRLLGAEIVDNHGDFRLMSRRAIESLSQYQEVNLFLRGVIPQIGYPVSYVSYKRCERIKGKSKYSLKKMINLGMDGITSFSIHPLRIIMWIGIFIFFISIGMLIYSIIRFLTGNTVSGWTSLAVSIWALGGIQLFCIGIVGEYIGKIYMESKKRPRYFVEQFLTHEGKNTEDRKEKNDGTEGKGERKDASDRKQ